MAVYTINTTPPSRQPSRKPAADPKKKALATGVGTLMLIGVGVAAWMIWPDRLPPADASPVELLKFAASDKFAELPDAKKRIYVDAMMKDPRSTFGAMREANLTDEQRENFFMNAMSIRMNQRVDEWL